MATEKLRNSQRLICHYDLFSQIVRIKKAMSKRTFFCFNAASDTLHEDLRTLYCCRRHTFATKALLCNTIFLYSWQWRVAQQYTQNAFLCFHSNNNYVIAPQCYVTRTLPILCVTQHYGVHFNKDHIEHSQKYGMSISTFLHEDTFSSLKRNSATRGFEKYDTVYQHIFIWVGVGTNNNQLH
jgi:hypothetical protein